MAESTNEADTGDAARFEAFSQVLVEFFELKVVVTRESRLIEDLEFDSLMRFECSMLLEEVSGSQLADEFIAELRTVDDLYGFYVQSLERLS